MTTQPTNPSAIPFAPSIRTPAAMSLELLTRIATGIEAQNAHLATLTDSIAHLIEISDASAQSSADAAEMLGKFSEAWSRPATAVAATPAPAGPTVVFMAEVITLGYDDKGGPTYRVKGGQYSKWGVIAYPEVLSVLGVDPATLKPGPNPFSKAVVALMGEKHPKKVIGLAK